MRLVLILLATTFVCACNENTQWLDTTGQRRTQEQATPDFRFCYTSAGFPLPDPAHQIPAYNVANAALHTCMAERGWREKPPESMRSVQK